MIQYDFKDQTVLISGAGGGLGSMAAEKFAAAGANLILTDFNDASLELIQQKLSKMTNLVCISGDISNPELHTKLVQAAIDKFTRLDIAINNAGIGHQPAKLEKVRHKEAKRVMEVDVLAIIYAMQAQIPVMTNQFRTTGKGGVILNTASAAGIVASPTLSVYSAAKHAIVGLSKSAAVEVAQKGIRINTICPAFTQTPMIDALTKTSPHGQKAAESQLAHAIPMGRIGKPQEIVQAMLWACTSENSFFTGQNLILDGGLCA